MQCYSGTSGFSYKEWHGGFYPKELKEADRLTFYSKHLNSVEINNTFYRMPKRDVLRSWADQTPESFRFVIKASRRITHQKRLLNAEQPLSFLFKNTEVLGERLGSLLFQLPPNMRANEERLAAFLSLCPADAPIALEFRHESWQKQSILDRMRERNIAFVCTDGQNPVFTADWSYLRLRESTYTENSLEQWHQELANAKVKRCFAFFKHEADAAPEFARSFQKLGEPEQQRPFAQL